MYILLSWICTTIYEDLRSCARATSHCVRIIRFSTRLAAWFLRDMYEYCVRGDVWMYVRVYMCVISRRKRSLTSPWRLLRLAVGEGNTGGNTGCKPRDRASRIYKVEREPLESATRRLAPERDAFRILLARSRDSRERKEEDERIITVVAMRDSASKEQMSREWKREREREREKWKDGRALTARQVRCKRHEAREGESSWCAYVHAWLNDFRKVVSPQVDGIREMTRRSHRRRRSTTSSRPPPSSSPSSAARKSDARASGRCPFERWEWKSLRVYVRIDPIGARYYYRRMRAFEMKSPLPYASRRRGCPKKARMRARTREWNIRLYIQQDHAAWSHPTSVDARAFVSHRYYAITSRSFPSGGSTILLSSRRRREGNPFRFGNVITEDTRRRPGQPCASRLPADRHVIHVWYRELD